MYCRICYMENGEHDEFCPAPQLLKDEVESFEKKETKCFLCHPKQRGVHTFLCPDHSEVMQQAFKALGTPENTPERIVEFNKANALYEEKFGGPKVGMSKELQAMLRGEY